MGERESRKEVLDVWMLLAFSGYMFVGGRNLYSFLLLLSLLRPGAFYWYSIVGVENGFFIFILYLYSCAFDPRKCWSCSILPDTF